MIEAKQCYILTLEMWICGPGGLELVIGNDTLTSIVSGEWEADILFRCIWGNTAWLRHLANNLGMGIHLPPFKPIIDNLASKINMARQLQSHVQNKEPIDAYGLIHCRLAVVELLDVLIGDNRASKGLISIPEDISRIRGARKAVAKMEKDTAVTGEGTGVLDQRQIISVGMPRAIREFYNTPLDKRLPTAMEDKKRSLENMANFVARKLRAIQGGDLQVRTFSSTQLGRTGHNTYLCTSIRHLSINMKIPPPFSPECSYMG